MKPKSFTLRLLLIFPVLTLLLAAACGRRAPESDISALCTRWLDGADDRTLAAINRSADALTDSGFSDSVFAAYLRVFTGFPEHPAGNPDSLRLQTGVALKNFCIAARDADKNLIFAAVTDSLARIGQPYLTGECGYYLGLYRLSSHTRMSGFREMLDSLIQLPKCEDITQDMVFACAIAEFMLKADMSSELYIPMQMRAVEDYRAGARSNDDVDILSQTGYIFNRVGDYVKGERYLREAVQLAEKNPGAKREGTIYLYGNLANLYFRLGMFDKSLEFNSKAIAESRRHNFSSEVDLLRMRVNTFQETGQDDSAAIYFGIAKQALERIREPRRRGLNRDALLFTRYSIIERDDIDPDTLARAIAVFREMVADSTRRNDTLAFLLGLGLTRTGNFAEGIPLMENATRNFEEQGYGESIAWAYDFLMRSYTAAGMYDKAGRLFPRYRQIRDSLKIEENTKASIAADIRYESALKEEKNRSLEAELSLRHRSFIYLCMVAVLLTVLLGVSIFYIFQRRKSQRIERELFRRQISDMLSSQQEINGNIEAMSQELKEKGREDLTEALRDQLQPSLLSDADEKRFRQAFAALYPRFLQRLHARCPELTKSDELFCMLIMLNQSTDQIALALGILRASVNSARYRLRRKFNLAPDVDLDTFLTSGEF